VIVSKRIDWIFANSYLKKDFFISKNYIGYFYGLIIFFYGILKITQIYILQNKSQSKTKKIPNDIVIESAAPHMHLNYFRHFNNQASNSNYLKIECFNKNQYSSILRLPYISILNEFFITLKEVYPIIGALKSTLNRKGVIREVITSLPVFAYFVCLLRALQEINSNLKLFSGGAPLISSAAILLNIETYYLTHGFINKPIEREMIDPSPQDYLMIYPEYSYIYTYSLEEKAYLTNFGIKSSIKQYPYKKLENLKDKIIIFLNYTDFNMDKEALEELIDVFYEYEYEIVIKIHPTYMGNFDSTLRNIEKIRFEDCPEHSAQSFMQIEMPKFACGWISTTLCEASNMGILPICLSNAEDELFNEVLYPLKKKSLLWHNEKDLILKCIENDDFIQNIIKARFS